MATITPIYGYTASDAQLIAGTLTQWGEKPAVTGGTVTWKAAKGSVQSLEISETSSTVEQTTVEDRSKRYVSGLGDGAETSMELYAYANDTDQIALIKRAQEKPNLMFKVQFSNGWTFTFEGVVTGWSIPAKGPEDLISITISVKISGAVTSDFNEG